MLVNKMLEKHEGSVISIALPPDTIMKDSQLAATILSHLEVNYTVEGLNFTGVLMLVLKKCTEKPILLIKVIRCLYNSHQQLLNI